jgi:hypothetical protein
VLEKLYSGLRINGLLMMLQAGYFREDRVRQGSKQQYRSSGRDFAGTEQKSPAQARGFARMRSCRQGKSDSLTWATGRNSEGNRAV